MPYALGIDIGASYTKAAIRRVSGTGHARSESLLLGADSDAASTVLHVAGDGSVAIGEAAEGCDPAERDRIIRGFPRRIGDGVPFMLGDQVYPAEQLLATMIAWVVDQAAQTVGEEPAHVTISYPVSWQPYKISILRAATDQVGLTRATLCSDLVAAALDYAAECQLAVDDLLAVCDLGATAFRAAVLRRSGPAGFELVGVPEQAEPDPGTGLDEAVLAQVRAELGAEVDAIDPADPIGWQAAVALRRECALAAETLAVQPQVVIPVALPAGHTQVVVTRSQLEDAARPAAKTAALLVRRAIRSASVHPRQLSAILLAGGSARSPLVSHAVSTELRRPVAVSVNPRGTAAKGAAVAAAQAVRPGLAPVGQQLARRDQSTALVRRAQHVNRPDETMVLMPEYLSEEIDDLDEEMPERPPIEITPPDLGVDEQDDRHWWQRLSRRGTATVVVLLALGLGASTASRPAGTGTPSLGLPDTARTALLMHDYEDHL